MVELGAGSFSTVRQVQNKKTGEWRAVKFLPNSGRIAHPHSERLILESLQSLGGNRHLITVYEWWLEKDSTMETCKDELVVIMELCNGGSMLHQFGLHKLEDPIPRNTAFSMTSQIADGLSFMHSHGFYHMDVKPDNILINWEGMMPVFKLCDFGNCATTFNVHS